MESGIYTDLSNDAYRAETGWASSSTLKNLLPEHFKAFSGSASADMGSILHQRFTGEDVPIEVVDALTWTGKAAKEALAAIQARGNYAILAKDLATVDGMEASLRAHGEASDLLVTQGGTWETSVFSHVDGVPSKCRFDKLTDSGEGVDLKTTKAGPGRYNVAKTVIEYGYDLSEAHYRAVAAGAGVELAGFTLVFVGKDDPYPVTVATLDEAFLERGRGLRDAALQRWLHPTMVEAYEGQLGRVELTMPGWARL